MFKVFLMVILSFFYFISCGTIAFAGDTMPFEKMLNYERIDRNLAPLAINSKLQCASQTHALDTGKNKYCSAVGSDRSSFATRMRRCGFEPSKAEQVIVCNEIKPSEAIKKLLDSPKHKQIVLDPSWEKIGCGMHQNYWVCVFSR